MEKIILLLSFVIYACAYTIAPLRLERDEPKFELVEQNDAFKCKEDSDCPQPKCFEACSYFACENNECAMKPPKRDDCFVGGCFRELCVNNLEDAASMCLWKEHYKCYTEYGSCVKENDICKWKETEELQACIKKANV